MIKHIKYNYNFFMLYSGGDFFYSCADGIPVKLITEDLCGDGWPDTGMENTGICYVYLPW